MIVYLICAVLMFALWFGVGIKMPSWDRPSWQTVLIVSIVAGVFWPLALAYIVVVLVAQKFG